MNLNKFVLICVWSFIFSLSILSYSKIVEIDYNAIWIPILHPLIFYFTLHKVISDFLFDRLWFTLENIHLFFFYTMLGLGSIAYILTLEQDILTPFHFSASVANKSIILTLIGIAFYRFSHVIFKRKLIYNFEFKEIDFRPLYAIFLFTFFCKIFLLQSTSSYGLSLISESGNNISPIFTYIKYISQFNLFVLSIMSFYFFSENFRSTPKYIYILFIIASLIISLTTGYKEDLLNVIFAIMVPYSLLQLSDNLKVKLKKKYFIFGVIALVVFVMIFPIIRYMYFIVRFSNVNLFDVVSILNSDSLLSLYSIIGSNDGTTLFSAGLNTVIDRLTSFEYLCAAVEYTPSIFPFSNFEKYNSIIMYSLIPRIFWAAKPLHFSGIDFTYNYKSGVGLINEATNPTLIGWGYLEFGVIGVVIFMLIWGFLSSVINYWLTSGSKNTLLKVVACTMLFTNFFTVEKELFSMLAAIPIYFAQVAIFYLGFIIINKIFQMIDKTNLAN